MIYLKLHNFIEKYILLYKTNFKLLKKLYSIEYELHEIDIINEFHENVKTQIQFSVSIS